MGAIRGVEAYVFQSEREFESRGRISLLGDEFPVALINERGEQRLRRQLQETGRADVRRAQQRHRFRIVSGALASIEIGGDGAPIIRRFGFTKRTIHLSLPM
jgi:hypothetical protein